MTKNTPHLIHYTCFYFLFTDQEKKNKIHTRKLTYCHLSAKCTKFFFDLLFTNIMYSLKNILLFYVNYFSDKIPTSIYHTNHISLLFSVPIRRSTNSIFFFFSSSHLLTPLTNCSCSSSVPVLVPVP